MKNKKQACLTTENRTITLPKQKNGRIIDFGDDGVYLGWFEEDDHYLHKKRQQILAE